MSAEMIVTGVLTGIGAVLLIISNWMILKKVGLPGWYSPYQYL